MTRQGADSGANALDILARMPRINAWIYSRFAAHVRGRVLEVGSGIGNVSAHLVKDSESVLLTDVEPGYLRALERRFADQRGAEVARYDLEREPPAIVKRTPFDAVLAVNVIEHLADDARAVRTLARLLAPNGNLLICVPAMPFAYGALDEALGHYRRYTRRSLERLLRLAGLEPGPVRYMNLPGLVGWLLHGRVLGRRSLPRRQVAAFEKVVPLVAAIDRVPWPLGLSVYACARKPR
ncbi:MAG: class I SAM-dependent methyltransferase [Myxococcota bacterium]